MQCISLNLFGRQLSNYLCPQKILLPNPASKVKRGVVFAGQAETHKFS
jgi:hypothetical protein